MAFIDLPHSQRTPSELRKQHVFKVIERTVEFEQEREALVSGAVLKAGNPLFLQRTLSCHDLLHDTVAKRMLADEDQMMAGARPGVVPEGKWQDVTPLLRAKRLAQFLDDAVFTVFGRKTLELFAQGLGAQVAEQRSHMLLHDRVAEPHVDPVVIEKEKTIATPILENGIDKLKREPLIAPRIHEKQRRHQTDRGE